MGITGRIASGKSTVCSYIKKIKKNALILDIDVLAKDIYTNKPGVTDKLREIFGDGIFSSSGDMDFGILASKVFSDRRELEKLNRLMFPLIRSEVKSLISKNSHRDYIIIDAAILFDCRLYLLCDYIILVITSRERRKTFLSSKVSTKDDIESRIKGQHIRIDRKKVDFTINNSGSLDNLMSKVKKIMEKIN